MDPRITATKFAKSMSEILNRVQDRGESFIIERNGEEVAKLAPTQADRKPPITLKELATQLRDKGLIPVADEFADDLAEIQAS